jgi:hypothetical protein
MKFNTLTLPGDWGLGIGDWGWGPIPNPQSPIPIEFIINFQLNFLTHYQVIMIS